MRIQAPLHRPTAGCPCPREYGNAPLYGANTSVETDCGASAQAVPPKETVFS